MAEGSFTVLLFFQLVMVSANSETCINLESESCGNVHSLKGLLRVMEGINEAMDRLVSSTRFRAERIEADICRHQPLPPNSSADDTSDYCWKAEEDCSALYQLGLRENGVYRIWPRFLNHSIHVYCDMTTDGGGWTVIQRRGEYEPHINFYETWEMYKNGFGNLTEEFWLGNDLIFALTNHHPTMLRIDLEDFEGEKRYAKYPNFLVRSEQERYKMTLGTYKGNAGDAMKKHNGAVFGTKDSGSHCAKDFKGGWWYAGCHEANLNGIYHHGFHSSFADGINWLQFRGFNNSMKTAEMKIRVCDC